MKQASPVVAAHQLGMASHTGCPHQCLHQRENRRPSLSVGMATRPWSRRKVLTTSPRLKHETEPAQGKPRELLFLFDVRATPSTDPRNLRSELSIYLRINVVVSTDLGELSRRCLLGTISCRSSTTGILKAPEPEGCLDCLRE